MDSEVNFSEQIVEAASWRVAASVLRRYPMLRILETHPGGGQYDCLSIYATVDGPEPGHIDLNRRGSAHVHQRFDDPDAPGWRWDAFWTDVPATPVREVVGRLSCAAGLPRVEKLPSAPNEVLIYRVISSVMTTTAFDSVPWTARMGYADTSGGWAGLRDEYFKPFPRMTERLRYAGPGDLFGETGYRFWFLLKGDEPIAAFERDGTAETLDGEIVDLRAAYVRADRRIWSLAHDIVGQFLS